MRPWAGLAVLFHEWVYVSAYAHSFNTVPDKAFRFAIGLRPVRPGCACLMPEFTASVCGSRDLPVAPLSIACAPRGCRAGSIPRQRQTAKILWPTLRFHPAVLPYMPPWRRPSTYMQIFPTWSAAPHLPCPRLPMTNTINFAETFMSRWSIWPGFSH